MLRIWGRISSINVQKVVWCALELGCEFERIDAGGAFGVVDTPAFGRLNPNHKVPVIDDDGFVLWESNAIVRYLCAKYPGRADCCRSRSPRAPNATDGWTGRRPSSRRSLRDAFWQLIRTPAAKRQAGVDRANRSGAPSRCSPSSTRRSRTGPSSGRR